ncbi:hypothetical protein AXG93_4027s1060 [Marchantia polymorpha subsp. ruderalis]|uniref:Uncharacterized protein n=1 Tax=Marchantia polymorpha subsp. ruderalis TaxID=1480154 RepID=A0A176W5S6_MARPO|nr:hypothetical protein AXG93_4027s1060 [Marchantia polymorpha subsp. ruderalis]
MIYQIPGKGSSDWTYDLMKSPTEKKILLSYTEVSLCSPYLIDDSGKDITAQYCEEEAARWRWPQKSRPPDRSMDRMRERWQTRSFLAPSGQEDEEKRDHGVSLYMWQSTGTVGHGALYCTVGFLNPGHGDYVPCVYSSLPRIATAQNGMTTDQTLRK